MTREDITGEALSWLRTPYHFEARLKGVGVDCGTFLLCVFEACGYLGRVDVGHYSQQHHLHSSEEKYLGWVSKFSHEVPESEAGPGDVVMYRVGRCFSHGSIVISWPDRIIHSVYRQGVILSHGTNESLIQGRARKFFSVFGGNDASSI